MFELIILDLDDTLYDYKVSHSYALNKLFSLIEKELKIKSDVLYGDYEKISFDLKDEIGPVASSHNKTIYLKNVLIKNNASLLDCIKYVKIYWNFFFEKIKLHDGVLDFLEYSKKQNIKLVCLTDYTINEQLLKLEKLEITNYFDDIITSEEVGFDKPNSKMFLHVINKYHVSPNKVLMVGDSYEKDIKGAIRNKIPGILISQKEYNELNFIQFNSFEKFNQWFLSLYESSIKLERLCLKYGQRNDLVQAAGGNISVKFMDFMLIKSSGVCLFDVTKTNGISLIYNKKIIEDIQNGRSLNYKNYLMLFSAKPSMEFSMHSILKKITVHLHPIDVIKEISFQNYENPVDTKKSVLLEYYEPGINLFESIFKYKDKNIFLMKNHGMTVSNDFENETVSTIDTILNQFSSSQTKIYQKSYEISKIINSRFHKNSVTYFSDSNIIKQNMHNLKILNHYFPDSVVYCGKKIYSFEELVTTNDRNITLILDNDNLYINSTSIQKCREIEDIVKALVVIANSKSSSLDSTEISKILDNEDEIYRMNLTNTIN